MSDNSQENLKTLWQSQKNEVTGMTLTLLRQRVHDLNARRRREVLAASLAAAIVLTVSAFGALHTHSFALQMIFGLATVWALAGLYFVKRGLHNSEVLDDSTLHTGIEFYRLQVQQNLDVFKRLVPWTYGPVILSILALVAVLSGMTERQNQPLSRIAPFCILFVLWLILIPFVRSRRRRELARELELLNSLENAK